jgi:hypothetical protein
MNNWQTNTNLSLQNLQQKAIALLCLVNMTRQRLDIGLLQHQNIHFSYLILPEDSQSLSL